jgi:hypothetical protein
VLEQGAVDALGDELGARLVVWRLRLGEVDARDGAGIELVAHDLERPAVGATRVLERRRRASEMRSEK